MLLRMSHAPTPIFSPEVAVRHNGRHEFEITDSGGVTLRIARRWGTNAHCNAALSRTYLRLFLVFTAVYLVVYALSQWTQTFAGSTPTEPDRGLHHCER